MKTAIRRLKTLPVWFYPLALLFIGIAGTALGAETGKPVYTPLVGIPGVTDLKTASLGEYLNALYLLSISIGGLIGVVKISMAGVKYSMSDIVTSKEEAKEDIKGVLLGLGILLIPAIVLGTINPDLLKLDVLKLDEKDKIKLEPSKANTGGDGSGGDDLPQGPTTFQCSSVTPNLDPGQTCMGWCLNEMDGRYNAGPPETCVTGE